MVKTGEYPLFNGVTPSLKNPGYTPVLVIVLQQPSLNLKLEPCIYTPSTNAIISKMRYLFISCIALDLEKDVNTFGRGTNNDICFEPRAFKKNPQYQAISTKHFKLYRVGMCIALFINNSVHYN